MKKNKNWIVYKSVREFGRAIGLTDAEMDLTRQKKKLILKIKATRLAKNISQTQLATMMGTKQPAIARMESGLVSEVSMDFILKALFTLELTVTIKAA